MGDVRGGNRVEGDTDAGVTDAGAPVKIGGKAATGGISAVTAGQRQHAWVDLVGRRVVTLDPTTDGVGLSTFRNAALSNTATAVKASAGRVYGYNVSNPNASQDVYLHFYDVAAGSVVVGTTTPKLSLWVPANGGLDSLFAIPIAFGTAITVAISTTATGGTAPSSGGVVNLFYL